MIGLNIFYHCPTCDKTYTRNIGLTHYYEYKNKTFALIQCHKCGSKLLAKTMDAEEESIISRNANDKQAFRIAGAIFNYINQNGYTNNTPEEQLENDLIDYLKSTFGETYITKYEYEAKVIIQKCISHMFNTPLDSLESYVITDEIKKEIKHLRTTAW